MVATTAVSALASPDRYREVNRTDKAWIAELRADIEVHGFRNWLEIVVDDGGRLVLRDGYHRLVVAQELGVDRLPVTFTPSPRIPGFKHHLRDVIVQLVS